MVVFCKSGVYKKGNYFFREFKIIDNIFEKSTLHAFEVFTVERSLRSSKNSGFIILYLIRIIQQEKYSSKEWGSNLFQGYKNRKNIFCILLCIILHNEYF